MVVKLLSSWSSKLPVRIKLEVWVLALKSMDMLSGGRVNGVPCAWPKCFWLRARMYLVILAGASIVVQSLHCFGSLVGFAATLAGAINQGDLAVLIIFCRDTQFGFKVVPDVF
jgi:hypothetical protein